MRPKRAKSFVVSRCAGKHSTPCSPSARSRCLKSASETDWARSIPSILAPNALPLGSILIARPFSIDVRARRFDDRPPFRELRLDERRGFLGGAFGRRIDARLFQAAEYRGIGQRGVDGFAQPIDNSLRRACRGEDCVPGVA